MEGLVAEPIGAQLSDRDHARLTAQIAQIDAILIHQLNAILHTPRFQKLEASWRGLRYLVDQVESDGPVKFKVLNVRWSELALDIERAVEFDQTTIFRKIYSDEFGTPGGEPYGLLIGDYEVSHIIDSDHRTDDIAVLEGMASVAAAAFAPFIVAASPSFFGVERFDQLERPFPLARFFEEIEYHRWRPLRRREDARFIGIVLPKVLARAPYRLGEGRRDGFPFEEDFDDASGRGYLWGTAVYAFAGVVARAYERTGWLADIRGVDQGETLGGVVTNLPPLPFDEEQNGARRAPTDWVIPDSRDKQLSELGFIPLSCGKDSDTPAFYTAHSIQQPATYDREVATVNAAISVLLPYLLCVSRFAHYVKVISRNRLGSFVESSELEDYLHRWIQRYVTTDENLSAAAKARFPLREARILVREQPGRPGSYACIAHLRPHFQLEQLVATLKLQTTLTGSR